MPSPVPRLRPLGPIPGGLSTGKHSAQEMPIQSFGLGSGVLVGLVGIRRLSLMPFLRQTLSIPDRRLFGIQGHHPIKIHSESPADVSRPAAVLCRDLKGPLR